VRDLDAIPPVLEDVAKVGADGGVVDHEDARRIDRHGGLLNRRERP
jgi:hypothetical protein